MLTWKSVVAGAAALIVGAAMIVPSARAGEQDELSRVTIRSTQPLEVPDKVLPPGTYVFKIHQAQGAFNDQEQNTIDIMDAKGTKLIATVPARPVQRKAEGYGTSSPQPTISDIELGVAEGSGSHPAALLTWYYPSKFSGHQFVYKAAEQKRLDEEQKSLITLKAEKGANGEYVATFGTTGAEKQ